MPIETIAPLQAEEAVVTFAGGRRQLRHLTGWDLARLARAIELAAPHLGLAPAELANLELNPEGLTGLAGRIVRGLIGEVDLEDDAPKLGPAGRLVYRELGRLVDPPIDARAFVTAPLAEQLGLIEAIIQLENRTVVGKALRAIAAGTFHFLRRLEAVALQTLALIGSRPPGGTTTSSVPSGGPITGETPRS